MKCRSMAFAIAFALLVGVLAVPVHAGTIFTEDFNSASAGSLVSLPDNFSEEWASTYYYLNPAAAGWTFNSGALLAVNGANTADKAVLLNEGPTHAQAINASISGLLVGQTYEFSFDHWGDNRSGTTYSFTVSVGDLSQSISRLYMVPGLGMTENLTFVADSVTETLTFLDTSQGQGSAIVDNIMVKTVPEPSLIILLGLGIGSVSFAGWRFKR